MSRGIVYFVIITLFFLLPLKTFGVSPLNVVINEIAWMGTKTSPNDEWIELYNNTDFLINLEGWILKANDGTPEIHLTGVISPKSFYLLERTDDNTVPGIPADQIYTGALGNNGENLELYDDSGNLIDSLNCSSGWFAGDNSTKQTMERKSGVRPGSDPQNWQTSQNPGGTPKAKNDVLEEPQSKQSAKEEAQEVKILEKEKLAEAGPPQVQIYPSGLIINEILPSPTGPDETEEWIEIFNQNNFEVDLSDWKITDTVGKITTYTFPKGTKISAQGFLVLSRPTTKIILNNDGDGISLIQPDGKIVETINYPKAPPGQSYNRTENEEWIWSTTLTPGSANIVTPSEIRGVKGEVAKKSETQPQKVEIPSETKREVAAIGEQLPKFSKSLFIFLIALGVAIFSGVIILLLKRKIKAG